MKLTISLLSLVIKCNLNQKNHPIGDFLHALQSSQMSYESESSDYDIHQRGIESTRLIHVQVPNGTFLMKMLRGKPCFLLQFHETVIGHLAWKQVFQMFTDIFLVIMLETAETSRMKQDKNDHNLSSLIRLGLLRYPLFLSSIIYFSCYNANSSQKSSAIQ